MFIDPNELPNRLGNVENLLRVVQPVADKPPVDSIVEGMVEGMLNQPVDNTPGVDVDDVVEMFSPIKLRNRERAIGKGAGRVEGDTPIPQVFRDIIGLQANISGERGVDIAKAYGISQQTVSNLKHGHVDPMAGEDHASNKIHRERLNTNLGKVRDIALEKLVSTLTQIDDDKLVDRTARELSQIAANLSRVVIATIPKDDKEGTNINFQTLFYSPETKKIDQYPVVEA